MKLVSELMERAARATPASTEARYAGWWLRHTDSETWWAGAVLAHGSQDKIGERIDAAEQFYADHEAPPRLTAGVHSPPGCVTNQAVRLHAQPAPTDDLIDLLKSAHPTGWQAEMRMISRVGHPSTYVTAYLDGVAVGTGRGVADDGATGVFHMATVPHAQGNGVAQTGAGRDLRVGVNGGDGKSVSAGRSDQRRRHPAVCASRV